MEFLIVTGMSGAGKSRAVDALEDIGFYCVDNLPPILLGRFAQLLLQAKDGAQRVALIVDSRGAVVTEDFDNGLAEMRHLDIAYRVMFLDCEDGVLVRRYKETRRRHPLMEDGGSIREALTRERKLLSHIKNTADYLVDTSRFTASQLREQIVKLFLNTPQDAMTVQCMSFGFKYGTPREADVMLDVRCFPNPFYVDELKHRTGLEKEVQEYVLNCEESAEFEKRLYSLVEYMLPLYRGEGKSQLTIAIGCTGGKHRSVTFTERLADRLQQGGAPVIVNHRDIKKL